MPTNRPDRPLEHVDDGEHHDPEGSESRGADPVEREGGANAEKVTDRANLTPEEDEVAPGVDPDEGEA